MKPLPGTNALDAPAPDRSEEMESIGSIGRKAIKGIFWSYASFLGGKFLVFLSTIILARLLSPVEFGQMGFALVVLGYVNSVGDFGLTSALIFERKQVQEAATITFFITVAASVLWFGFTVLFNDVIADFFHDAIVSEILEVIAWVFIITALGSTQDALLQRELDFHKRIIPGILRALLKGTASIILALLGWGVWSLVWGHMIGEATATLSLWLIVRWRPVFTIPMELLRKMLSYGGQIVSVNILAAIIHHVDLIIVGHYLGGVALGLYSIAYRIPELLVTMIIWVIGNVTFPAYAKLQNDRPALQNAFLITLRYLSLLTIPAGFGVAMLSSVLIPVVFGNQWIASVPVLQALAVAATLRSLGSHAGDVYKATGRPDILTKLGILRAALMVPSLIWATRYGIEGVSLMLVFVTALSTVLNLLVACKIIGMPARAILSQFKAPVAACAVMIGGMYLFGKMLSGATDLIRLIVLMLSGAALFIGFLWIFRRDLFIQVKATFRGLISRE